MQILFTTEGDDRDRKVSAVERRSVPLALFLMAAVFAAGCASFPRSYVERSTDAGATLLRSAADAHGWTAYRRLNDINVSYEGDWYSAVTRLQPVLVDSAFRGSSEERLLRATDEIGQHHRGPGGSKQVARAPGRVGVWYNDIPDNDREKAVAASLVADGYRLFLLGPMFLIERNAIVEEVEADHIDGVRHRRLFARLKPGLGHDGEDRVLLWLDESERLTRRIWISADALSTTQGVIAEIDVSDYRELAGVKWPTRFFERLRRPFPLDVHRWRLVGLDVDRGYRSHDINGPAFRGSAAPPAARLAEPK